MAIKCMAFDMDRTTLNAEGKLSQKNKEAFEYAIKKGVHVVIASGRAFSALPKDVLAVKGIEYAITSNGAEVYRIADRKCLKRYCISPESVVKIMELTKDMPVTFEAFIAGEAYAGEDYVHDPVRFGASQQAVEYVKRTRRPIKDIDTFILEHKKELSSIDVIVKDEALKREIWQLLKAEIEDIYITSSIPQLIEISDRACGKHSGLIFLTEYLGITKNETAAFGDADNDTDMLLYAGCGVAVANASEGCLKAADMVVPAYDKDGVAEGICKLLQKTEEQEDFTEFCKENGKEAAYE